MEKTNNNLLYNGNKTDSTLGNIGKKLSYLGRTLSNSLIRTNEYFANAPQKQTNAYCKLLELEYRVNGAYKKVLKDVSSEIMLTVTKIYEELKKTISDLKKELYSENSGADTIEKIYQLDKEYKNTATTADKIGTEAIYQILSQTDDLKKTGFSQKFYDACLDIHYQQEIQEEEKNRSSIKHPNEAYLLKGKIQKINERFTGVEDKNIDLSFSNPNGVPEAEQFFTHVAVHKNIKGMERHALRLDLGKYISNNQDKLSYEEKQNLGAIVSQLLNPKFIPGILEMNALADMQNLNIRVYSNDKKDRVDFGSKVGAADLTLICNDQGNLEVLT